MVVLYIAGVSLGLHACFELLAALLGYDDAPMMWGAMEHATGLGEVWWRLVIYGGLQILLVWLLTEPLKLSSAIGEKVFDVWLAWYGWVGEEFGFVRSVTSCLLRLVVRVLLGLSKS